MSSLQQILTLPPDDSRVVEALRAVMFEDVAAAQARLKRIGGDDAGVRLVARCLPALLVALSETGRPDHALINFERLLQAVPDRRQMLQLLGDQPRAIEILVRLFVGSQFLTEIVLRNPGYVERLTQHHRLADLKSVQTFYIECQGALMGLRDPEEQLNALRRFQRWELLRIGVCDFFGLLDLKRVTVQLSLLADSLVRTCLGVATEQTGTSADGMAVIAMGKLGGEELNYSSDIDLLFVAQENGQAYLRLAQHLIRGLTLATADGFLYRVDMRLRPWGNSGELVSTQAGHLAYLQRNAQHWEKQALLKARVIAGDLALGKAFLKQAEPLIFTVPPDEARTSVRGIKQKIEAELQRKGRLFGEVKLGEGSIRDVEFVVQYLQLVHGGQNTDVRTFNTLDALVRLADFGFLHADEYRLLSDGYVFLRTIEHSLQLMHNKQTHELPTDPAELRNLARRLDFPSGEEFLTHFRRHGTAIRAVYERYLGEQNKAQQVLAPGPSGAGSPGVKRHVARLEQAYAETFTEAEIERHAVLAERVSDVEPILVDAGPNDDGTCLVTIVGFDFPGELSHICGLMLVHGLDIVHGEVFTYEPVSAETERGGSEQRPGSKRTTYRRQPRPVRTVEKADMRRKIVDVFTVQRTDGPVTKDHVRKYAEDLASLIQQVAGGKTAEAQGALVKRVAAALREHPQHGPGVLYPIDVQIDNDDAQPYTVLRIETRDTIGFLYELTNALALHGMHIARVHVESAGAYVRDTLYVTDVQGRKITDPHRQHELQTALVLIKHFTHLLPRSPNPEAALLHFREFLAQLFSRPEWTEDLATLERSDVMDALARLLGVSDFLWNDFLRMQHANLFPVVRDVDKLATARTREELEKELDEDLRTAGTPKERREKLNAFKDREMFRVDMRHILGHSPEFRTFSGELTDVAEIVVMAACRMAETELRQQHGYPRLSSGEVPYAVFALGKCGGRELGFASDIELMFVYAGDGKSDGPQPMGAPEFFIKLVECVTHAIHARREGIFEIDLRLRPYGKAGSLAVSLEAFDQYFRPEGPAWPFERQALVKLRPIGGNFELGNTLIRLRDEFLYTGKPFDVVAMRAMRERQVNQLVTPGTFNAKLSPGGVVDIEYLVQGLQITHGHQHPDVRAPNTRRALEALAAAGIIPESEGERLDQAYVFLRSLIDGLRIVRGNAKDLTVPLPGTEEFAFLARRLGYNEEPERLERDLTETSEFVREASLQLLG